MGLVTRQKLKKELMHQLDLLLVTILAPMDITPKKDNTLESNANAV